MDIKNEAQPPIESFLSIAAIMSTSLTMRSFPPPPAPANNPADLQAEIRRLEQELERKKLEDQIRQLEEQVAAAKGTSKPDAPPDVEYEDEIVLIEDEGDEYYEDEIIEEEEEDGDEYYSEEEILEETEHEEEEIIEEEVIEEEVVEDPMARVKTSTRSWPPQVPLVDEPTAKADSLPVPAEAPKPRAKWVPLSQRKPDLFSKGPNVVMVPGKGSTTKPGSRPPVKFTPRRIPSVPASPSGEESAFEKMLGQKLIYNSKLNKQTTNGCLKDQKLVCLYFAAGWRTECKRFNPLLSDFYKIVAQKYSLECVYVSVDRTLFEFKDHYGRMPFLAMPTGTTKQKNEMTKQMKINDLPALVVLDAASGQVVTTHGVDEVTALENRNPEQAYALVEQWLKADKVPINKIQADKRLKNGNLERKGVYWQE